MVSVEIYIKNHLCHIFIMNCYLFPIKFKYLIYIVTIMFCMRHIVIVDLTLHIELVLQK